MNNKQHNECISLSSLEMLNEADGQLNAVFACFGSAAQHCQLFEQALSRFLSVYNKITHTSWSLRDFEKDDARLQKQTMGGLLKELKQYVTPGDESVFQRMDDALTARNYLMHHFFIERNKDFSTEANRFDLLKELVQIERVLEASRTSVNAMRIAMCEALHIQDPHQVDYNN